MTPLASIIIPVYNGEKFLRQCLDSCLDQAPYICGKDYEIICVNDGSSDSSLTILQEYAPKGVTTISQANAGVSAARNTGITAAKGKYVWAVDCDDLIKPRCLRPLVERLNESHADGIMFNYEIVHEDFGLAYTRDNNTIGGG